MNKDQDHFMSYDDYLAKKALIANKKSLTKRAYKQNRKSRSLDDKDPRDHIPKLDDKIFTVHNEHFICDDTKGNKTFVRTECKMNLSSNSVSLGNSKVITMLESGNSVVMFLGSSKECLAYIKKRNPEQYI
tara:strand:- start:495 stop:887 length:393 start_codon:yes stop_codon:yes gene_type:complete